MQTLLLTVLLFNLMLGFIDAAFTGGTIGTKITIAEEIIRSVEGFAQTVSSINFANPISVVRGLGGSLIGGLSLTLTMVKSIVRLLIVDHAILSDGFMVYMRWFLLTINCAVFLVTILPALRGGKV